MNQQRVLFVSHAMGGGVDLHVSDLAELLTSSVDIEVLRPAGPGAVTLQYSDGSHITLRSIDWRRLSAILGGRGYCRIHFHHIHGHLPAILDLPRTLGLPFDVTLHDYFAYCPKYQLNNPERDYCGEPDATGCQICVEHWPNAWGWSIAEWRTAMGVFLSSADRVIAPTNFVAERMACYFPTLKTEQRDHPPRARWIESPRPRTKILLIGALSRIKGLEILTQTAAFAKKQNLPLTFCVLGFTSSPVPPELRIQIRGEYQDENLPTLVSLERADVIWFPGQFRETHSYTLDVAIASGLPIVASDQGAFHERLASLAQCTLLDPDSSEDEWNSALLASGRNSRNESQLQSRWPLAQESLQRRHDYLQFLTEPIQRTVQKVPSTEFSDELKELETSVPSGQPWSLPSLYEHGVLCGKTEPKEVLQRRLYEVEKDYLVLLGYERRLGEPWYILLERTEEVRDALSAAKVQITRKEQETILLQKALSSMREQIQGLNAQIQGLNAQIQGSNAQIQGLNAQIQGLNEKTQDLDAEVQRLTALDLENDQNISELSQRLVASQLHQAETERLLASRGEDLTRAVDQIRKFENSTSWRLTKPLRSTGRSFQWLKQKFIATSNSLRKGIHRIPMAREILRTQGSFALAERILIKFRGSRDRPAAPVIDQHPIGSLSLGTCSPNVRPRVSIVIPVYGQHWYTFNCLKSLGEFTTLKGVEVIVVDDSSPEPVEHALGGVHGIQIVRNEKNLGFIGSCNRGANLARGEFLVLLNNDVQVTSGWLEYLLETFHIRPKAGLVGARLVYPDGKLQEAGGIVWQDGSAWNWGRGQNPENPPYRYLRSVDYCSGACLAIRKSDWDKLGGFDATYAPAYYEDTDLAFRVRAAGMQVYYQPEALIVHYEGVTSGTDEHQGVKRHQVTNKDKFFSRWKSSLKSHRPNGGMPWAEANRAATRRILIVEACMITPDQDSGSVRMLAILEILTEMQVQVTFVADNLEYRQPYVGQLQQRGVEVWHHPHVQSVAELIEREGSRFDAIMFCRHYIACNYIALARKHAPRAKIWFDTVDLHYLREERLAALQESTSLADAAAKTRKQELSVIDKSDLTFVVSPVEQSILALTSPHSKIAVLSNIHEPVEHTPGFKERMGLLFVGGFQHPPNVDAVVWFVEQIWPLIAQRNPDIFVRIVGSKMPESLRQLQRPGVEFLGYIAEIESLLLSSRISIAPLRYGAGVKGKVNQAMAFGLPVVATTAAVEGMKLTDGLNVLIAQSPQDFAEMVLRLYEDEILWNTLSGAGKSNVGETFSRTIARDVLSELLSKL